MTDQNSEASEISKRVAELLEMEDAHEVPLHGLTLVFTGALDRPTRGAVKGPVQDFKRQAQECRQGECTKWGWVQELHRSWVKPHRGISPSWGVEEFKLPIMDH